MSSFHTPGASSGAGHYSEVLCIEVGEDQELVAPVVDRIVDLLGARAGDHGLALRVVGGNQQDLGERLAATVDDDPLAAAAQFDVDVEAFVGLLEDQCVVGLGGAQVVAPHPVRTHRFVGGDVEQRRSCRRTTRAAPGDVVYDIGRVDPRAEITDAQCVLLATFDVGAPRQQLLIGADVECVDREEVLTLGLEVLVEQDLRCGVGGRSPAAVDRIVATLLGPRRVPPLAVLDRGGDVGLLNPRLDLTEDRFDEFVVIRRTTPRSMRSRLRGRRSCRGRFGPAATPTDPRLGRSGDPNDVRSVWRLVPARRTQ